MYLSFYLSVIYLSTIIIYLFVYLSIIYFPNGEKLPEDILGKGHEEKRSKEKEG
jgi:hypothetical protein